MLGEVLGEACGALSSAQADPLPLLLSTWHLVAICINAAHQLHRPRVSGDRAPGGKLRIPPPLETFDSWKWMLLGDRKGLGCNLARFLNYRSAVWSAEVCDLLTSPVIGI